MSRVPNDPHNESKTGESKSSAEQPVSQDVVPATSAEGTQLSTIVPSLPGGGVTAPSLAEPREWFGAWRRFWFTPADPTPLALIRIFAGLIAIYVFALFGMRLEELAGPDAWLDLDTVNLMRREQPTLAPGVNWQEAAEMPLPIPPSSREWVSAYETEWGVDPRQASRLGKSGWSWWYHLSDPSWMPVAHAAYMLVLILFTLGCGTRIVSVLAWSGALAYIHRAPNIQYGIDTFLLIVLMYSMIGPCGAVLSIDRWWSRRRAVRRGEPEPAVTPSITANIALRLMQIHLCIIYLRSAMSKLQGPAWWDGTAVWPTLVSWEFSKIRFEPVADMIRLLCRHRWLWEIVVTSLSLFTVVVELCAPVLIWYRRTRWWALAGLFLLHLGIGMIMSLMTFSLISMALSMSFLPADTADRVVGFFTRKRRRRPAVHASDQEMSPVVA